MLDFNKNGGFEKLFPFAIGRELITVIISSLASLAVLTVTAILAPDYALLSGLAVTILYFILIGTYLYFTKPTVARTAGDAALSPILGNIMNSAMTSLKNPAVICDEDEEVIIWNNTSANSLTEDKNGLRGAHISEIFSRSAADMFGNNSPDGTEVTSGTRSFRARGYRVKTKDRPLLLFVFYETTELERLYSELAARELSVAYIMIDNLDDMIKNEQESYRSGAGQVDRILRDWAAESGGILKEYERERYLFVFEAEALSDFIIKKFDILDRIRDVRVGDGSLPITVSMGVSNVSGTFAEREKAAQSALDMALQRGGDQAVVKNESSIDFYGGRSKTVQKRTKVRARVIATELIKYMSRASNVIIMAHKYADFDALGASVGLARLAMLCGVEVNIVSNPRDANLDACRAMLANVADFNSIFVDSAAALDKLQSDTLLVIADVNNFDMLECRDLAENCRDFVLIDHHRKTAEFAREPLIQYIEPSASATCELVSEMLEQVLPATMLTPTEANMLFAGILLDTKQFTKNTGTRTFSAAMYLRDHGASPTDVQELFKTDLDEFVREAKFRSNIVIYRNITAISLGDGEGEYADRIIAAKAADRLLAVSGVQASFALIKIGDNVHISARSTGSVNVQLILEALKGGGHFDSAGAQIESSTVSGALVLLKEAIDKYLDSRK